MSAAKLVVAVMGAGDAASSADVDMARQLGVAIAERGWVLLTGGRNCGVMAAASQAAYAAGGLTMGYLPGESGDEGNPHLVLPLPTGMGSGRNQLNVLAARAVVVCGDSMGPGTLSELALALKAGKPTFLLAANATWRAALAQLHPAPQMLADVDACLTALDALFEHSQRL